MKKKFKRIIRENREQHTIVFRYPAIYNAEQSNFKQNDFNNAFCFDDFDIDLSWEVKQAINDENEDLAEYIDNGPLVGNVKSIKLDFDINSEELIVTCILFPGVEPNDILEDLKEYVGGQLSDGWGEGFEQQDLKEQTFYVVSDENGTDDELRIYDNWRDAESEEESLNEEVDNDKERDMENGEDLEDESYPYYSTCDTYVTFTCSFYDRYHTKPNSITISSDNDATLNEAIKNFKSWQNFTDRQNMNARWFAPWTKPKKRGEEVSEEEDKHDPQRNIFAEILRINYPELEYCKNVNDIIELLEEIVKDIESGVYNKYGNQFDKVIERFNTIIEDLKSFDPNNNKYTKSYNWEKTLSALGNLSKCGMLPNEFYADDEYIPTNYGESGDEEVDDEFLRTWNAKI